MKEEIKGENDYNDGDWEKIEETEAREFERSGSEYSSRSTISVSRCSITSFNMDLLDEKGKIKIPVKTKDIITYEKNTKKQENARVQKWKNMLDDYP